MCPCTTATSAFALPSRNCSGVTGADSSVTSWPSAASTFRISRNRIPIPAGWLLPSGSGQTSRTRLIGDSPRHPEPRRRRRISKWLAASHLEILRRASPTQDDGCRSSPFYLLDDVVQLPGLRRMDHVEHRLESSHLGVERLDRRLRFVERAAKLAVLLLETGELHRFVLVLRFAAAERKLDAFEVADADRVLRHRVVQPLDVGDQPRVLALQARNVDLQVMVESAHLDCFVLQLAEAALLAFEGVGEDVVRQE